MSTTVTANLEHVTQTTSRATVRSHTLLVDRGTAKGGWDLGPAGGEYLVVALGGCFTSHLAAVNQARQSPMTTIRVAATGTMDGTPERFTAFTLAVTAHCADAQVARKFVTMAGRACQVVNTLRAIAPVAISYDGAPILIDEAAPVTSPLP